MLIDTLLLWKQVYKLHWSCSFVLCPILLEQKVVMGSFILEMAIWEGGVSLLSALLLCCLRALKLWGSGQAAVLFSLCSVWIPPLLTMEYSGLLLVLGNSTVYCLLYIQQWSLQQQPHIRTVFSGIGCSYCKKRTHLECDEKKICGSNPGTRVSWFTSLRVSVNGENIIFELWKGEESNKCWSLALKLADSGCILLAVLFPSIRGALCPSIPNSCSQLCFGCDGCFYVKTWLSGACTAFVNIQRLLLVFLLSAWYICPTDLMEIFLAPIS